MARPLKPRTSYQREIQAVLRLRGAVSIDNGMSEETRKRVKDAADIIVETLARIEATEVA